MLFFRWHAETAKAISGSKMRSRLGSFMSRSICMACLSGSGRRRWRSKGCVPEEAEDGDGGVRTCDFGGVCPRGSGKRGWKSKKRRWKSKKRRSRSNEINVSAESIDNLITGVSIDGIHNHPCNDYMTSLVLDFTSRLHESQTKGTRTCKKISNDHVKFIQGKPLLSS
jgi:hypothetical protein